MYRPKHGRIRHMVVWLPSSPTDSPLSCRSAVAATRQLAKRIAHIPAWVFHGAKDPAVPLERSKQMVEALKKNGGNPKFTVYPEAGHDAWTKAYNTPELYEWLLQQKRTRRSPKNPRSKEPIMRNTFALS